MSNNKRDSENNCHPEYTSLEPEKVLKSVVNVLSYLVAVNDGVELPPLLQRTYSCFASPWTYEWATVDEYITRLMEWIVCGPECFIVALVMMKKLEAVGAVPPITQRSFHRTYLTCLMLGVKFVEDETLCNADFAKVGCVATDELNRMERKACIALSFGCALSPEDYEAMRTDLAHLDSSLKRKSIKKGKGEPVTLASLCGHSGESKRKFRFSMRNSQKVDAENNGASKPNRRSLNLFNRKSVGKDAADKTAAVVKQPAGASPSEAPIVLSGAEGMVRQKSGKGRFSMGKKTSSSSALKQQQQQQHQHNAHHKPQAVAFFRQDSL